MTHNKSAIAPYPLSLSSQDQSTSTRPTGAPWLAVPAAAPMLRPRDVVKATGMTKSVIYDRIGRGLFPPFIKLGERTSAMPAAWLDAYIRAQADIALTTAGFAQTTQSKHKR